MHSTHSPARAETHASARIDRKPLPSEGFIRQSGLIPDIVPFSPATLWRKVKNKEFPAPVKLSARITAWRVQEIREWLERQK